MKNTSWIVASLAFLFSSSFVYADTVVEGNTQSNTSVTTNIQGSGSVTTHIESNVNGNTKTLDSNQPGTYTLDNSSLGSQTSTTPSPTTTPTPSTGSATPILNKVPHNKAPAHTSILLFIVSLKAAFHNAIQHLLGVFHL